MTDWNKYFNADDWLEKTKLFLFPFHHLIPAENLTRTLSSNFLLESKAYLKKEGLERSQFLWQLLAAQGLAPRESLLFDSVIDCHIRKDTPDNSYQLNWSAGIFDELAGCAEMYRAEMMFVKRRIYELKRKSPNDKLPNHIAVNKTELTSQLNLHNFALLTETAPTKLFIKSLLSAFECDLAVEVSDFKGRLPNKNIMTPPGKKIIYKTYMAKKFTGCESVSGDADQTEAPDIYRLVLSGYWNFWHESARKSMFDFNFLESLTDAREIRFYELSKLLRVQIGDDKTDKIPNKLEIDYETLISLMPLPRLRFHRERKEQIQNLIKPLKRAGYVKSFSYKTGKTIKEPDNLIFRFYD